MKKSPSERSDFTYRICQLEIQWLFNSVIIYSPNLTDFLFPAELKTRSYEECWEPNYIAVYLNSIVWTKNYVVNYYKLLRHFSKYHISCSFMIKKEKGLEQCDFFFWGTFPLTSVWPSWGNCYH